MALKSESSKSKKMKFDNENSAKIKSPIVSEDIPTKNKHIKFDNDDDGDGGSNGGNGDAIISSEIKTKNRAEKKHPSKKNEKDRKNAMDIGTHWYQVVGVSINYS